MYAVGGFSVRDGGKSPDESLPSKGVVNSLDEFEIANCITTQSRREFSSEMFELL